MDYVEEDYDYAENNSYNFSYDDYQTMCEKDDVRSFARVFQPVVYGLCLVVGVAGNALVVAVYVHAKRARTLSDALVVHLAVADLLLLLTLPFWASAAVRGWELGEAPCKLVSALYTVNFTCSMIILACISLDRYLALTPATKDGRLGRAFRKENSAKLGLVVWATAFLLGIPDLVLCTVRDLANGRVCMAVYPSDAALQAKVTVEVLQVVLSFLAPLAVMVYCYTRVVRTLLSLPLDSRGRRRWRPVRVLLVVVGTFVLTQLPYNVLKFSRTLDAMHALVTHCGVSKALDRAVQITRSLALTHCCLNPVLYAFIGASFRQRVLKFAKSVGQWRRSARRQVEGGVDMSFNSNSHSPKTSSFSI
ncbi:atypical chemokine receptor 4 isoform X2 [Brachyhypopomus gauderio]